MREPLAYVTTDRIESERGFPYGRGLKSTVSVGGDEMENQGQGPAWVVFLLWMLAPLLLFFLILTFTG